MDFTPYLVLVAFIAVFFLFSWWSNKRKVKGKQVCVIVTKSNELVIDLYPKADGKIVAPVNKLFKDNSERARTYFYSRPFSLKVTYPLLPSFFSKFTAVDAYASLYEEGDPSPILPSNAEAIQTPERVNAMATNSVVSQVMGSIGKQFNQGDGTALSFGKHKTLMLIMIAVVVLAVLISAYAAIQILGFIPYAQQWMALR